jgi:beta-ribofuranosylaminobenzene 5'-phosphate synthase
VAKTATVTAYPRLHFGLADLGHATARKYGGAGVVLDWPAVEVEARSSAEPSLHTLVDIDERTLSHVSESIGNIRKISGIQTALLIKRALPEHAGLGSKTALILAALRSVAAVSNVSFAAADYQRLSRRAGVSGVGLHGFFSGGFIVDAGQPQDYKCHIPSSAENQSNPPMLAIRENFPDDWRFHLVLPDGVRYGGASVVSLFQETTPIAKDAVRQVIALIYHGLVPAVRDADFGAFAAAIVQMQQVGFKAHEISAQNAKTKLALNELSRIRGTAVGMSSVGPAIFVAESSSENRILEEVKNHCQTNGDQFLGTYGARNASHSLKI